MRATPWYPSANAGIHPRSPARQPFAGSFLYVNETRPRSPTLYLNERFYTIRLTRQRPLRNVSMIMGIGDWTARLISKKEFLFQNDVRIVGIEHDSVEGFRSI
jgi:hypothetical protein